MKKKRKYILAPVHTGLTENGSISQDKKVSSSSNNSSESDLTLQQLLYFLPLEMGS